MRRIFVLMLIATFSVLSLGPPVEASSFPQLADNSISIDQDGATFNEPALSLGNFGGNGRSIDLGPPVARVFILDKHNNIGLLDNTGIGVIATATPAIDLKRDCATTLSHLLWANLGQAKAGPRHSIVE
jgi:hypothetical protein